MESGASKRSNICSPTCVTIPKSFVPIPGKSTKNPKSGQADEHYGPMPPRTCVNSPPLSRRIQFSAKGMHGLI